MTMAWLLKQVGGSQVAANIIVLLICLIISLIIWGSGYIAGRSRAEASCQTAVLEASNRELQKALEDQREIARRANARAVVDAGELSTLRAQVEDLTDEFETQGSACTLSSDDVRRLRGIR